MCILRKEVMRAGRMAATASPRARGSGGGHGVVVEMRGLAGGQVLGEQGALILSLWGAGTTRSVFATRVMWRTRL